MRKESLLIQLKEVEPFLALQVKDFLKDIRGPTPEDIDRLFSEEVPFILILSPIRRALVLNPEDRKIGEIREVRFKNLDLITNLPEDYFPIDRIEKAVRLAKDLEVKMLMVTPSESMSSPFIYFKEVTGLPEAIVYIRKIIGEKIRITLSREDEGVDYLFYFETELVPNRSGDEGKILSVLDSLVDTGLEIRDLTIEYRNFTIWGHFINIRFEWSIFGLSLLESFKGEGMFFSDPNLFHIDLERLRDLEEARGVIYTLGIIKRIHQNPSLVDKIYEIVKPFSEVQEVI